MLFRFSSSPAPVQKQIDPQGQTRFVDSDGRSVEYDFADLDELQLAYAVSIHRSQGSEYPAVVVPLTTGSWLMLQRNLLYTAVTRARRLVVLVGSRRALAKAVRTEGAGRRYTALATRLQRRGERIASPEAPLRRVAEQRPASAWSD